MQRKHAFPGMFFIINERLRGPLYGSVFCAAPILSSRPAPSFPPSPSPGPVNQRSWLSPDGRQSVISNESEASLSLSVPPPFHAPLPPRVFPSHLLCGLSVPPSAPLLSLYSLCFPPEEVTSVVSVCPKEGEHQTWLSRSHKARCARPHRGRPGIIYK